MNSKQRVHAVLEGKPVDRFPVTAIYNYLIHDDFFAKVTGEPQWKLDAWLNAPDAAGYLHYYRKMRQAMPFEILQPHPWAPNPTWCARQEFVIKDGKPFRHDRSTNEWFPIAETKSGHARDYHANEDAHVRTAKETDEKIVIRTAEQQIADGLNGWIEAVVSEYGTEHFILSGGVVGTFYACGWQLGQTNVLSLMREDPELVHHMSKKVLAQNIEDIRRFAKAGGDAVYIDDATTTNDMISVDDYEEYSLPYITQMVAEAHRLGQKVILIYFGGVADRLEQIASTGADGLVIEASMKGFTNDIEVAVARIGRKITLFSNIDPIATLQDGTDEQLRAEIKRQCTAGRKGRGMVVSTASPITPQTSVERIRAFVKHGIEIGSNQV